MIDVALIIDLLPAIIPFIILFLKAINTFKTTIDSLSKSFGTDSKLKSALKNEGLSLNEKKVLNNKLIKSNFKKIFKINLSKINREKVSRYEVITQGRVTYDDFAVASPYLSFKIDNINVNDSIAISYEKKARIYFWVGLTMFVISFLALILLIVNFFAQTLGINDFLAPKFLSIMYLSPLYIIASFIIRDQYRAVCAILKIKKYYKKYIYVATSVFSTKKHVYTTDYIIKHLINN